VVLLLLLLRLLLFSRGMFALLGRTAVCSFSFSAPGCFSSCAPASGLLPHRVEQSPVYKHKAEFTLGGHVYV
jgi:hypothetical protein